MKFIKANLTLVICGAVVLLSLVAWLVWPLPGLRAGVQGDMGDRYNEAIGEIGKITNTSLILPGQPTISGPPSADYVRIKKDLISEVNSQKTQVDREAREVNARGRVNDKGVPLLQVATLQNRAIEWGKAEPNLLPVSHGANAAFEFKSDYGSQFDQWASLLATGKLPATGESPAGNDTFKPDSAAPQTMEALQQEYQNIQQKKAVSEAGPGAANTPPPIDPVDEQKFYHDSLVSRANQLYMYVDPGAFQVRSWLPTGEAPSEDQIFTALVDSWLQADVVRAIAAVNNIQNRGPGVDQSPVKRLIHITVGNAALDHVLVPGTTASGGSPQATAQDAVDPELFYPPGTSGSTSGGGPNLGASLAGGGTPIQPAVPNKIDYTMGMTGHASGGDYDVVFMSIHVDIDPAKLIEFMDKLYLQNVGYTVTDVQLKTVDPLDRTGNGYIYGNSQAVEAEIQVEAILFRSWTAPLMPASIRASRGIPEPVK